MGTTAPPTLLTMTQHFLKEKGLVWTVKQALSVVFSWYPQLWYYQKFKSPRKFQVSDKSYNYLYRLYNTTWRNGRCIEVPYAYEWVKQYKYNKILEVGNVMSYYYPVNHKVIDKYEVAPNVENVDIVDYNPNEKYDLIVAVSTMEHVGHDMGEQSDPYKVVKAFEHLKSLLVPGGKFVVTIPPGQNSDLDRYIKDGIIKFDETHYMKRISKDYAWREVTAKELEGVTYRYPFPHSHAIIFGIVGSH